MSTSRLWTRFYSFQLLSTTGLMATYKIEWTTGLFKIIYFAQKKVKSKDRMQFILWKYSFLILVQVVVAFDNRLFERLHRIKGISILILFHLPTKAISSIMIQYWRNTYTPTWVCMCLVDGLFKNKCQHATFYDKVSQHSHNAKCYEYCC